MFAFAGREMLLLRGGQSLGTKFFLIFYRQQVLKCKVEILPVFLKILILNIEYCSLPHQNL